MSTRGPILHASFQLQQHALNAALKAMSNSLPMSPSAAEDGLCRVTSLDT